MDIPSGRAKGFLLATDILNRNVMLREADRVTSDT